MVFEVSAQREHTIAIGEEQARCLEQCSACAALKEVGHHLRMAKISFINGINQTNYSIHKNGHHGATQAGQLASTTTLLLL